MSQVRKVTVSNCEKKFLLKNLAEWNRLDGRAFDEFRNITITFGKDWGCCMVSLGKTKVIAQVSCEIQVPKSSCPSEGILNVNMELNTIAAPHFESGRQTDLSVQLNRLLEKCIKDSKAIDLESLCIKMNEKVWAFRVDVNVLNHEGNLLDCASVAALSALAHFRRPDVTCDGEEFIIHAYKQRDPIPTVIHHYPICITYAIFEGNYILADPTLLEEGTADAFLTVSLNSYKELCGLHLGGKAELTTDLIISTTNKASARANTLVQLIKECIAKDIEKREQHNVIGFHIISENPIENSKEDLNKCLDYWNEDKKKHNKKNRKVMDVENNMAKKDNEEVQNKNQIEQLGEGSAALFTNDCENAKVWQEVSDDSDNDVVVVEQEKPKPIVIDDTMEEDDSEEEEVIVINADKKTNKRRKK